MKEEDKKYLKKATEDVDMFLSILSPWFHPDKDWDKIENISTEFLFEGIVSALKDQHQEGIYSVTNRINPFICSSHEDNLCGGCRECDLCREHNEIFNKIMSHKLQNE